MNHPKSIYRCFTLLEIIVKLNVINALKCVVLDKLGKLQRTSHHFFLGGPPRFNCSISDGDKRAYNVLGSKVRVSSVGW